jgi:chitinase
VEPNETLTVTLSAPVGATIADGTATGTIKNDD